MDAAVSIELFVEILNRYVYHFDQQNEAVREESFHSKLPQLDADKILNRSLQSTSTVS